MKFVSCFVLAVTVAVAAGAALNPGQLPQETIVDQLQYLRDKRSSYGTPYYAPAPCASSHLPVAAPAYLAPIQHAAAAYAPSYGYGLPALSHYRSVDEPEMLSFSDMDQMQEMMGQEMEHPMARYAYGSAALPVPVAASHYGAPAAAAIAGLHAAPAAAGPAIGVFPNANTGGCSVPLLLSCSPTISSGHIVKSHYGGYGGGEAYRGVDEQRLHEGHESAHDQTNQMTANQMTSSHDANPSQMPVHQ